MKRVFFIMLLAVQVVQADAQSRDVVLKQGVVSYTPSSFYISDVMDDRADKSVGTLKDGNKSEPIHLHNGTATAIKSLTNVPYRKGAQAIVLHISTLNYTLRKQGRQWTGSSKATFVFYAAGKKVIEYSSSGDVEIPKPEDYIESFLRQALEKDLKRFDAWWPEHKGAIPTIDAVKVNVEIGRTMSKPDVIVYSPQRPLQIRDFKGPADNSVIELAATFSGIGFLYSGKTEDGQVVLDVTVTPYFDISQSWFKENGKNPRVLAHEQTHFNITAIKACELVKAIKAASLTQENYAAKLKELQTQNMEASNAEQSAYDTETNHGTIEGKQHEWEQRISEEIKKAGCY